jgi:HEAT repeat protein
VLHRYRTTAFVAALPACACLLSACRTKTSSPASQRVEGGAEQAQLSATRLVELYLDPAHSEDDRASYALQIWERYEGAPLAVKKEVRAAFHAGLEAEDLAVRRSAMTTLSQLAADEVADVAVEWLTDPRAADVRDVAINCVYRLNLREHIGTIRSYVHDENPDVQIAALKALSTWGDAASREAIAEAARSTDPRVRRAAEGALRRLDRVKRKARGTTPTTGRPSP